MKLILSALFVTSLLALNASAQPTPAPAPGSQQTAPPPVLNKQLPAGPRGRPNMPPGLAPGAPKGPPPVMPDKDKLSYAIGFNIAGSIKRDELDIDVDTIATAMKEVLAGKPTRMDEKEVKEIMTQFQGAMRAKTAADREKKAAEAKAKNEEFLAKNGKDPAVKTLPNGLQYKVLKEGTGEMPKPSDNVVVAYKGTLPDGTMFDSNTNFATPVTGRTIKGWSEILPLMKSGSKWEVVIPAELGYGTRGMPPKIPANSVLIFEMELISIAAPSPAPAPAKPAPSAINAHPGTPPPVPPSASSTPVVSGQIIKVPSAEELKNGAKIEVITNAPGQ